MKKHRKEVVRFIVILLIFSLLAAIFTAAMIYFFQVKDLPTHDWNYIKENFWILFLFSMIGGGLPMAINFYDHDFRKRK